MLKKQSAKPKCKRCATYQLRYQAYLVRPSYQLLFHAHKRKTNTATMSRQKFVDSRLYLESLERGVTLSHEERKAYLNDKVANFQWRCSMGRRLRHWIHDRHIYITADESARFSCFDATKHLEPADALPVTKDVDQRVVLSRFNVVLVSNVCLLLFDRQPLNVQIRSHLRQEQMETLESFLAAVSP